MDQVLAQDLGEELVQRVDAIRPRVRLLLPRSPVSAKPPENPSRAAVVRLLVARGLEALELELTERKAANGHSRSHANGA